MSTPFASDLPAEDGGFDDPDAFAQLAQADVADADLLCLVLCATGATMLLALAASLT